MVCLQARRFITLEYHKASSNPSTWLQDSRLLAVCKGPWINCRLSHDRRRIAMRVFQISVGTLGCSRLCPDTQKEKLVPRSSIPSCREKLHVLGQEERTGVVTNMDVHIILLESVLWENRDLSYISHKCMFPSMCNPNHVCSLTQIPRMLPFS